MRTTTFCLSSSIGLILFFLITRCTVEAAEIKTGQITTTIKINDTLSSSDEGALLLQKMRLRAQEAQNFIKEKNYNAQHCYLLDMSIHSGKNRFFVYDLKKDSLLFQGLVSHGCCDKPWGTDSTKQTPHFSNVTNSHCSSLGKYKIGKRGYSNWGIHVNYKLHGLDTTNSNAYERFIVLHSWNAVSNTETYPMGTPEGWGCPAVSNTMMKRVDSLLKKAKAPTLLWIYQ